MKYLMLLGAVSVIAMTWVGGNYIHVYESDVVFSAVMLRAACLFAGMTAGGLVGAAFGMWSNEADRAKIKNETKPDDQ